MDPFAIAFILIAGLGIFGFYSLAKRFYKGLKKNYQPPKAADFVDGDGVDKLGAEFDHILWILEQERARLYGKTKGLFKRAWFRTFLVLFVSIALLAGFLGGWDDVVGIIIGPMMMSAFAALIGAGIYTLVKKGTNSTKFSKKLKQELVTKIVKHVNSGLDFSEEGIEREVFEKADLFTGGKQATVTSEDKIIGRIDGKEVLIVECQKRGPAQATVGRTNVNIGGKTVSSSHKELSNNSGEYITIFKGLFIKIELDGFDFTTPIKFVPSEKIKKEVKTGLDFSGYNQKYIRIDPEDKVELSGERGYVVYCSDKALAAGVLNEKVLKVADYIFNKYNREGEKVFGSVPLVGSIPIFKDIKYTKSIFLSIVDGNLYLAMEWPEDMFETDAFLKNDLIESGLSQKIYQDLQMINQLIKEVNLMNMVGS